MKANTYAKITLACSLVLGSIFSGISSHASAQPAIGAPTFSLGAFANFSVLGNPTSNFGVTTVNGDFGSSGALPPVSPIINGATHLDDTVAINALGDLLATYGALKGMPGGAPISGDLIGTTIAPGLYFSGGALADSGVVTLDGGNDPNSTFIFQIDGAFNMAAGARIELINGASAANVYFAASGAIGLGAGSYFVGTGISIGAINAGAGSFINGRLLSTAAVNLNSNAFSTTGMAATSTGPSTQQVSYDVTASPGGLSAQGTSSPLVITGLTPGVAYTYRVSVYKSKG
jgi:hypothetical protein